jgi:hypothetical protein
MTKPEDINPYAAPLNELGDRRDIVDRDSRDSLIASINAYADGTIDNFEFDERNSDVSTSTNDRTVHDIVHFLWLHYDDCVRHKSGLSKPEWDYFQRLLLILHSNAQFRRSGNRQWTARQLVAGVAVLLYLAIALLMGWGSQLLALALPFGLLSIALAYSGNRPETSASPWEAAIYPFARLHELRTVLESAPDFRKRRYPNETTIRQYRGRLASFAVVFQTYAMWIVFSPLVLLFQALPREDGELHVFLVPSSP